MCLQRIGKKILYFLLYMIRKKNIWYFIMNDKNNTISSITYDLIKRDIIFGKLKPSTKLKLDNLKNNYNASLSTIRETLNRLASEGFVKAEEQRGFFVNDFTKDDLIGTIHFPDKPKKEPKRIISKLSGVVIGITNKSFVKKGDLSAGK